MSITIDGTGTISGISVGGLENGCVNADDLATAAVTNSKLAANAVTIDKLGTTLQSQVCKAWVNFNGTGTVAIRAAYNVSSITDNGTGDYTVNFTTAMPDANYSWAGGDNSWGILWQVGTMSTSAFRFSTISGAGAAGDRSIVGINFFR